MSINRGKLLRRILMTAAAFAVMLCAAAALSGCGEQPEPAVLPAPAPESYTVQFFLKDQLLLEDTVTEGTQVQPVLVARSGLDFLGWRDAAGNMVDPEEEIVTGNTAYFAYAFPRLANHVPYLFPDAAGFLRPDAPLTAAEFADAIDALADPDAARYLPFLSRNDRPITVGTLRELLTQMFPADAVTLQTADLDDGQTITRAEAAHVLNALLGRSPDETVTLRRAAFRPLDVADDLPYAADLLEASVSHTPDAFGDRWGECSIPSRYAPGRRLLGGTLYCIGEDGCLVKNAEVDGFSFGPDGVYTSGNGELDKIASDILRDMFAQHPELDELGILRLAYDYCRDSFTYLRKPPLEYGETGWEIEYALTMFTGGVGNCYNYASTFWTLARALGFDARVYSGTCAATRQPHGFVEIEIDGVNYWFDTELEMAYRKKGNFSNDMFMMPKEKALNWNYRHA